MCRDCFVHLPFSDIFSAIENICSSGALYLLTTHFSFRRGCTNPDLPLEELWRPLNFEMGPFYWPPPQRFIVEGCTEAEGAFADKLLQRGRFTKYVVDHDAVVTAQAGSIYSDKILEGVRF